MTSAMSSAGMPRAVAAWRALGAAGEVDGGVDGEGGADGAGVEPGSGALLCLAPLDLAPARDVALCSSRWSAKTWPPCRWRRNRASGRAARD